MCGEYFKKKKKKIIRKRIGSTLYIIDKSTNFHLPVFEHPTAYQEWKTKKVIPFGLSQKKILFNYKGEKTTIEELQSFKKINNTLLIARQGFY